MSETSFPTTLPELCAQNSGAVGDHIAVLDDHGGRLTYDSLYTDALALAAGLADLGSGRGEVVGLLAPNSVEWVTSTVACHLVGAPVAAYHTWVKAQDLDFLLSHSEAATLLVASRVGDHDLLDPLRELLPELWKTPADQWRSDRYPSLRRVITIGGEPPLGARTWSSVLEAGRRSDKRRYANASSGSDVAFIVYTSGSTAEPKGVPLTQANLIENGFQIGERMGLGTDDRVWLGSPLFWSFGAANALIATLSHRASLVLQGKFDAAAAAAQISAEACTAAYLLPTLSHAFLEVPNIRDAFQTIRTGLTIGRPDEVQRVVDGLGVREICNVYGSTETYGNCCVTPHDMPLEQRLRCQGPPLPGMEIRIVDVSTGDVLPAGSEGSIEVRGRITSGYWKNPQLNAETFTADGWYRTGDVGTVDEDGVLTFVTRVSDMIKTSGINVSPAEVEAFISSDPLVAEAAVFAIPDPVRGEVVVAFIQPKAGAALTAEAVISRCRKELAMYKAPREVRMVDEMPHTATGKVARKDLRGLWDAMTTIGAADQENPGS